jgi:4-diphosphocytidyl-2-C-methyl-D-erythritol kinase
VALAAPAKLTLSLRITGVRSDGFHLLDSEMVTVDLADRLEFRPGNGLEVVTPDWAAADPARAAAGTAGAAMTWAAADPAPAAAPPTGPDNLVVRALAAVGRRAAVRLYKRIPVGAGLGGGSADAAAVLRWAGVADPEIAVKLGADVPFCLLGEGRARVRGVGELVEPLPFQAVASRAYTLLTPPFGMSTPLVYQAWDRLGGRTSSGPNDLEQAALAVEPRLARWRDLIGEATGEVPLLAGSGATWFVPGAYPGDGRRVVRVIPPARGEGLSGA